MIIKIIIECSECDEQVVGCAPAPHRASEVAARLSTEALESGWREDYSRLSPCFLCPDCWSLKEAAK